MQVRGASSCLNLMCHALLIPNRKHYYFFGGVGDGGLGGRPGDGWRGGVGGRTIVGM